MNPQSAGEGRGLRGRVPGAPAPHAVEGARPAARDGALMAGGGQEGVALLCRPVLQSEIH